MITRIMELITVILDKAFLVLTRFFWLDLQGTRTTPKVKASTKENIFRVPSYPLEYFLLDLR